MPPFSVTRRESLKPNFDFIFIKMGLPANLLSLMTTSPVTLVLPWLDPSLPAFNLGSLQVSGVSS